MPDALEGLLSRLRDDQNLFLSGEEATRQGAILPILARLGWDRDNIREVIPEFSVGDGRVDYCLRIGDKKVFIEVKRMNQDLDRHQEQLLQYAFRDGVELAVLTNGLLWWLYLPLLGGSWDQRKFFTIDLQQQEVALAVRHFTDFLSRNAVASGSAVVRARSIRDSRERERLITQTIPEAWDLLCVEPDPRLLELLAEKVEGLCGHKPEQQQLIEYLSGTRNAQAKPPRVTPRSVAIAPPVSPRIELPATTETSQPVPSDIDSVTADVTVGALQKGDKVDIDGTVFDIQSVKGFYLNVLAFLDNRGCLSRLQLPISTGRSRYLLASQPIHPTGESFRNAGQYKAYFIESHKSFETAGRDLKRLLQPCGLSWRKVT